MNVLVTSAGRRTSLVQSFGRAAHAVQGEVFAGDANGLAPSLYLADRAFQLPCIDADAYVPFLLSLIEAYRIKLIVPTIDPELTVLALNRKTFAEAGCTALISRATFTEVSGDKWLTHQTFSNKGVDVPRTWLPDAFDPVDLPKHLFVKPRDGSASRNTYRATPDTLHDVLTQVPNAIIQEELSGPEITIDALLDLEGRPVHYVPRVRIRTLAGESIQGVTISDEDFREWLVGLLEAASELGACGPITLQAFLTERGPVLIEVNPRFGGGFPLAYAAGGHYPEWLLAMLRGEEVPNRFGEYQKGLYMTRYHVEHFTTQPLW